MASGLTLEHLNQRLDQLADNASVSLARRVGENTVGATPQYDLAHDPILFANQVDLVWRDTVRKMLAEAEPFRDSGIELVKLRTALDDRLTRLFPELMRTGSAASPPSGVFEQSQGSRAFLEARLREFARGSNRGTVVTLGTIGGPDSKAAEFFDETQNISAVEPRIRVEPVGNDDDSALNNAELPPSIPPPTTTSETETFSSGVSGAPSRASTWTGRRPLREQVYIIRTYAPLAVQGLDELAAAIEAKCYNDDATHDALRILKELRAAIDDLILAAEGHRPLAGLWAAIEAKTDDLLGAAKSGAKIFAGAPIVGLGAAYVISMMTGDPVTGQMVATMAAGSMMADTWREKAK